MSTLTESKVHADGTRKGLDQCATMLETYGPDLYPANELGQADFARAMMDSVAETIRAFLANDPSAAMFAALLAVWQWHDAIKVALRSERADRLPGGQQVIGGPTPPADVS